MKVIARVSTGVNGKILVEMTSNEFAMILGRSESTNPIAIGTEVDVPKAFWRLHNLRKWSVGNVADQLELVARQLRPLDEVLRQELGE